MARAGAGRFVFMSWAALPIAFAWIRVGLFVRPALWGEPRRRSPQGGAPVASNSFVGLLRPHRGALSGRMTLCVLVTACVKLFCFLFEVFVGLYDGLCGLYDGLSDGLYDVHSAFNRIQSHSVAFIRIQSHSFAFRCFLFAFVLRTQALTSRRKADGNRTSDGAWRAVRVAIAAL